MPSIRALILAAALTAPSLALAQGHFVDRANQAAATGPQVYELDRGVSQFRGQRRFRPDVGEPTTSSAVPIPHVMNGGGFGLSGNDYYSAATTVDRVGGRRRPNHFEIAPAYKGPLH